MPRRFRLRCSLVALVGGLAASPAAADPRHESEAQRLHRQGVHCMDVIERNACAIEHFEELMDVDTRERALVTDGMLRLIDLYRDEGREDDISGLLRRFWDVGMKRESHGHVPWSTQFMPSELDVFMSLDLSQLTGSKVLQVLQPDAQDTMLTCDESRRKQLEHKRSFRRAEKEAARDGRNVWEVVQEQREEEAKREAKRTKRGDEAPVFLDALCPVMRALDRPDLRHVRRLAGGMNHADGATSVGFLQIDDLDPLLAEATASGRIRQVGPGHWTLPDYEYDGAAVHLLSLDTDELTLAPAAMVDGMQAAREKRKKRVNRELERLIAKVPRDAGFLFSMTQAAMREIGFGSMKRSTRSVLEALLPKPKGLQIAAIFGDYVGLFTRVPTDTPVKGRMLVGIASALVSRVADGGGKAEQWLDGLDIAEATDRRALLVSYLISAPRLQKLMLE